VVAIAPKSVPERFRRRYAGRAQLTVLSAVLIFLTLRGGRDEPDEAPPAERSAIERVIELIEALFLKGPGLTRELLEDRGRG
jgi:hypothetical protein